MPELPEVETIRKQLHEKLAGKTVRDLFIYKSGRETPVGEEFVKKVVGGRLSFVGRRAKVLLFQFENGEAILGHLKMTGKFLFVNTKYIPQKHDRILFVFEDNTRVMWSDIRQFGYLKFVDPAELALALSKYGPEPLETSLEELADRLIAPKTRKIKT